MKDYRNEIIFLCLLLIVVAGLSVIIFRNDNTDQVRIVVASGLTIGGLILLFIKLIRKRKDIVEGIPVKDEFTESVKVYTGNRAFHLSIYFWLLIFVFNDSFSKNEEMLGIGILGSCAIYGICYLYYKSTGNISHEKQD